MKTDNVLRGIAAAPGIAIAKAHLYKKEIEKVTEDKVSDVEEAKKNLEEALAKSKKELRKIFNLAVDKLGDKRAGIFEAQLMILDDPVLIDNIVRRIEEEKKVPEYIVQDEISKYQKLMDASNEMYMKERSHDIEDIKNRIIRNLKKKKWTSKVTCDVIIVTESISPSDAVLFTRSNSVGYVTNFGGLTSHAAIVARSLNIPAVVGVHDATNNIPDGADIIIDGFHGVVVVEPDEEQRAYFRQRLERLAQFDNELAELKDEPAQTQDGKEIKLHGNLDLHEEIDLVIQNGAKGIGLVRTEQLFGELESFPEEDEQHIIYKRIAEKVYPDDVTIRTFDVGGDKVLPVDVKEPNPFLGWRGVRFLLDNRDLYRSQIKAILRASTHKNVKLMIPMISSIKEITDSVSIINECKEELKKAGIPFDEHISVGIMIEVPSAAVMAKEFAEEVDFLSIGTNDLIQYLLAVDRGNEIVSDLYQEFHPAIIRTLKHIINGGKESGAAVSICGEMAADYNAVPLLVGLGLDSISVSPSAVPYIKKIIRSINYSDAKQLADECLKAKTEQDVKEKIDLFNKTKLSGNLSNLLKGEKIDNS